MTLEEFERATKSELRQMANERFAQAARAGFGDKAALYHEAKFYVGEIERRGQSFAAA
jgi:hypothetical protein